MAKRYAFPLFSGKKAEIPRILEQNCRNSPNCGAKRQKFPICWGKIQKFSLFWGKTQIFHLFWGKIAEISLISG